MLTSNLKSYYTVIENLKKQYKSVPLVLQNEKGGLLLMVDLGIYGIVLVKEDNNQLKAYSDKTNLTGNITHENSLNCFISVLINKGYISDTVVIHESELKVNRQVEVSNNILFKILNGIIKNKDYLCYIEHKESENTVIYTKNGETVKETIGVYGDKLIVNGSMVDYLAYI